MPPSRERQPGFEADLAPVITVERTPTGWRGLTGDGEILNVSAHVNGAPANIPESLGISRGGQIIGYRKVEQKTTEGVIWKYLHHLNESMRLTRLNQNDQALEEASVAMAQAPTALARYNRAMILLALGEFEVGFDEFAYCERESDLFMRPQFRAALDAGIEPWRGQDIAGKTLLLLHDHGHGDAIMCLRYIPMLKAMGATVIVQCPQELDRLVQQHTDMPVTRPGIGFMGANYVCSFLMVPQVLRQFPGEWTGPYVRVDPTLVDKWRATLDPNRKHIGIAWSTGKAQDGDYPRACPLELFDKYLGGEATLTSVQQFKIPETAGGGNAFSDFADCAALMSCMDQIVCVDTAAVHLAGAIGHPNVVLLLSHWHSWRWGMMPSLYPGMKIVVQDVEGDWDGVFQKIKGTASP
jgi:hypothetical protein